MTKNYKILGKYIKDISSETPDIETYIFVRDRISKYHLGIDINSKALKNKMIEINTTFKFGDTEESNKKSYFEIVYSTIIKVNDEIEDKKELEKIPFFGYVYKKTMILVDRSSNESKKKQSHC